jgi:hypothetical protein
MRCLRFPRRAIGVWVREIFYRFALLQLPWLETRFKELYCPMCESRVQVEHDSEYVPRRAFCRCAESRLQAEPKRILTSSNQLF